MPVNEPNHPKASEKSMTAKPAPARERLLAIRGLIFDCDGVLTDRGLFYDERGTRILRFDARDGFGLALWRRAKLSAAILSGRPTDIASSRFAELGVNPIKGRCYDKRQGVLDVCNEMEVEPQHCAFIGDDLPDLAAYSQVGLRIAVADAAPEIIEAADWVLHASGGHGAAREVCETILKVHGDWQAWVESNR